MKKIQIPIILLGNKYDIIDSDKEEKKKFDIHRERIYNLIHHYETMYNVKHYETIAKYGHNLDVIFRYLMSKMIPKSHENEENDCKLVKNDEKCCLIS